MSVPSICRGTWRASPSSLKGKKMQKNVVTEQLTQAGQKIEHDSFAIVDNEAGSHDYTDAEWQIVRRMIHATADFEFNGLTRFHPEAVKAGLQFIQNGANIVADV